MALEDLLGLGKILPIDKLIDVVSNSIGRISKSYFDRKDIDTKAYEIKKIAEARAEEMMIMSKVVNDNFLITGDIEDKDKKAALLSSKELSSETEQIDIRAKNLEQRTLERIIYKQLKKDINTQSVVSFTAEELEKEQSVTNEPIDEDWTTRFFSIVEDVSNEEMQALWGRILAGEIKQPKSYSLRTLELLKNLSKEEAEIFTEFAQLRVRVFTSKAWFIYNPDSKLLEDEFGIQVNHIISMVDLGLLSSERNFLLRFMNAEEDNQADVLFYGSKAITVSKNENTPQQEIEVLLFTKIGIELSQLIDQPINENYMARLCLAFKHPNVKVVCGDYVILPDGSVNMSNIVEFIE